MSDPLSAEAFSQAYQFSQDPAAGDRAAQVTFSYEEFPDEKASAEAGRPIFKSVEMCEIRIPGEKENIVVQRIKDGMDNDPRQRFPGTYARWKKNETQQVVGTPLRRWGLMEPAEARGYEDMGVVTVEQLASMSDQLCQQYRGSVADRQKARDFLEQSRGLEPVAQARAEIERQAAEIEALKEAIASLGGKVPEAAPAPKRRGRPPKQTAEG